MMKKKKQSRSQSSTKKTLEPSSSDSSPSPRLLSIFRSKLGSGKELKHMFRGMRNKTVPGLSSQSRIVRCPKCRKLLQEPLDATSYNCGGCDSILQAKRGEELEGDNDNSIPLALLSSENRTEDEFAGSGNKSPNREYNSRGYHSETVYTHETSDIRRADEFSVTGDSDAFNSARSSPYNPRSNASEWTQHGGRYEDLPPRVPFYAASPSPSSAYEYGYSSPFHGSQVSASEQSYYHHHHQQPNQYGRGSFQESDGKYYHWSSQSQLHDPQYHNLYESSSSATPHHAVYSERSYQAAPAPYRSTYSEHSKSDTSSEKSSQRNKKRYVKERNPVVKRHILPSAGGAPFATCTYCLELLQLPQVSPHGKHKRYQVRCGSCSGLLKFSVREKADTVLDSPSTRFVDETVTIHQDSASQGHQEIYPDDSHLSSSDNGSGDGICKSTDEPQPASSETTGETSRIHLHEADSEKLTEMDEKIHERVGYDLEESGHEKKEIFKPEEMVGDGSGESLEVPVYKNRRMSESSEEAETIAERLVSHSVEPLNKNEYIYETQVPSENTKDTHEFHWEETQENEEYGDERTWEESMGDKPGLHLENSRNSGGSVYDSNSSNGETFEDTDKEHLSNTFSDAISATPQSPLNNEIHEKQSQDGKPKQSLYQYENLNERQELDKTISERVRHKLEESSYETNETLEPSKVGKDGSAVSLQKASETFETIVEGNTGEERAVSPQMDSENYYGTAEPFYLEGSGHASERTWTETMEDRAGLHLEEYESNYENYNKPFEWTSERAPTFHMHEYELGAILEPEEDAESSLRGSFNGHESSEESAVFHESQDAKSEQSQYEYENSSESQELSNTDFDVVRSELQECRYETNETLEPGKMIGDGSVLSPKKAGETIKSESGEESLVSHQMEPQNDNMENSYEPVYLEGSKYASEKTWAETMGDGAGLQAEEYQSDPFEWTSERAPTFRLHEYEVGTMPEPEEDANARLISSSRDSYNYHESSKERTVSHEEEPWLVDENKTEALMVGVMVEDGPSMHLEKRENESTKLEETFEWTSEKAPTFSLREYEQGTMLESDEDANGKSESSSRGSYNNLESSNMREMNHEEEGENESMKLEETFEWTSERAPTFHLQEYELGMMLETEEDADERSRGSFNDHGISKEREMNHEEEPQLVIDSRTESLQVGELAKNMVSLHLEESENESMKLDETFEWTSGRSLTFRRHECELGTMLEPDEDADGRSVSSSRSSFNDHGSSKEIAVIHEDDYEAKALKVGIMAEDGASLHLEKCKNDEMELDGTLEARDDIFRLSLDDTLEQERVTSQDIPEIGSRVCSEGHESPSKMGEVDSESEEEILGEHLQKESEKSGLTFEPYARVCSKTEPSEMVGLRHALYETQSSPLRSPLTSPIHTPISSPLHYLMGSPMHSHIVSPMRSPINSSGSLSDVLFFGKKS